MSKDLALAIRINGDQAARDMRKFTDSANTGLGKMRSNVRQLWQDFNGFSAASKLLAASGAVLWGKQALQDSANLDRNLIKIKQTAGLTLKEMHQARAEIFAMARKSGVDPGELTKGLNNAVQAGLDFKKAIPVLSAANDAVAVTGANTNVLIDALTVAAETFNFDLSKPEKAVELLDKMTVAGRAGNAELEALSDIFSRVGVNAHRAGFDFDKTLAFVETLSQVEKNPERLGTLVDSTLRVFTNGGYRKDAQKATGVAFFDKKGGARDPIAVLNDFKKKYDQLKNDASRASFIEKAFGKTDQDTMKGLMSLFSGDSLASVQKISSSITQASGTIAHDLPEALRNAIDQANRLKVVMSQAGDVLAQPVNAVATNYLAKVVDNPETAGGLLKGGAAAVGLGLLARMNSKRKTRIAGELAEKAQAIEKAAQAAKAQNVFVTNWPASMMTAGEKIRSKTGGGAGGVSTPDTAETAAKTGKWAKAGKALGAAGAAFGGWEIGQAIGGVAKDLIDATVQSMANDQNATLGTAIYDWLNKSKIDTGGELKISVDDKRVSVGGIRSNDPRMTINVDNGPIMPGAAR